MFIGMSKREIVSAVAGKASQTIYLDSKHGIPKEMDIFFPMPDGSEKWTAVWFDKTTRRVVKEYSSWFDKTEGRYHEERYSA